MLAQKLGEKRHLLRWWVDTSGKDPEELRAAGALPCFGERLIDPAGAHCMFQTKEAELTIAGLTTLANIRVGRTDAAVQS